MITEHQEILVASETVTSDSDRRLRRTGGNFPSAKHAFPLGPAI